MAEKGTTVMDIQIENFQKALDAGAYSGVDRATWHKALQNRASSIRKSSETPEQAYARAVMDDDLGRLLFKAHQSAPLIKVASADGFNAEGAAGDTPEVEMGARHIGPGHAELHSRATDLVRAKPGLSYERAVANIYEKDPGLRSKVFDEHMRNAMAMAGEPAPLARAQQGGEGAGSSSEIWPADKIPAWSNPS
jgi:hypothetical protein